MFKVIQIRDTARVPPNKFGGELSQSIAEILQGQYEGTWDKDLGFILAIHNIIEIGDGKIVPGDGSAYYDTVFEALIYLPKLYEVVEGEVEEITEFGAFVRLGPIDGLVHVSQLTNDFINYDKKNNTLSGKESGRALKAGDKIRGRIVTLSLKRGSAKIGLTMRQPYLGKFEWIAEEKKEG
jgi:DNA-directed RNA polymerase subunit E'